MMIAITTREANTFLEGRHYLGPTKTATIALRDEHGVLVFGSPRSRRLPSTWVELVRWCIESTVASAGSRQWRAASIILRNQFPHLTTVVSYSDPSAGHGGALYRACNWLWAPTWHRLRPPPSGNGSWTEGEEQSVKDRWVFPLKEDTERAAILSLKDDAISRKNPWANYREPTWRRGKFDPSTGGADHSRFGAQK